MNSNMNEEGTAQRAVWFANKLKDFFGNRVEDVLVEHVEHSSILREFVVTFFAYNYYPICCNYDGGRFGCVITNSEYGVEIKNSQEWWETTDFNIFFEELKKEIELRIPDEFLKAKGWL